NRISFTSDRSGGDNIWTMNTDGSDLEQVTDESFRLLNNAAWTPDGEYLIARKHFTSTRSLGAGEMWLYHRSGGDGLQLTERRNDQQDQGNEPVVSPDGRYVYYSEDNTGGSTFEYNKDPNSGIYAIRRLDRETGDIETIIGGPGGAARPQPSPDGTHLAFVRRVRAESVLFLYDLATGAERPLFDGLTRDQQETWAVFGVYPNYQWMPDGSAIVIWAQGGLHRVDVETGEATEIPFSADVEIAIAEAALFEQDVAPERFTVRMMRDLTTSPDGSTVVFHAVGYLWKMAWPDGEVMRLTNQDEDFEYDPSFSPDGRTVVYTTFNDEDYGAIRTVSMDGGQTRTVTSEPGHYFTPRFSPDGGRIVYDREGGNGLRGPLYGVETGLYVVDARGGNAVKVRDGGDEPRFSADGERVYFQTGGGLSKQYLSVDLHGGDLRTHFTMKYPTSVVPSPDGKWIAFNEAFNVYVAPFPMTGGEIEISKDMGSLPVTRVSRDAGTELHWVNNGRALRWMIGPEVYTRHLDEAFAFRPGAPEELPEPDSAGVMIGMTLPHDRPEGTIALVGARIITMNGDEVIEDGAVVVEGNRIVEVGERGSVSVRSGAHVMDVSGHTIMPGMVDVHGHAGHFFTGPLPRANWYHYANLAYGVTTAHDPSANTETVFSLSELIKAGEVVGPRVFSTGTILYGADGDFRATINSLDDARSHLRRLQAVGAFSVKSYNQPRRDQRQQVLQAAHELGMMVYPEGGSTFFHNINQVIDGHTGIEHAVPVAPLYNDILSVWGATNVGYTPTLVVGYGGLWGENYWYGHTNVWEDERLLNFTPRGVVDGSSRRRTLVPDEEYWHITLAESAKRLTDRGVRVNLGAHGQMQGLAAHWETWMFGQGGMTPMEALRAATLNGAYYIGMDHELGSIEEGKLADLIVLSENPLDDLRNSTSITHVMANGRLFDAMTMNQVAPEAIERPPFWFEREGASDAAVWQDGFTYEGARCACEVQ
ncbi:MAG: amidohydrolase family protein, partial [Rubricoccaceae bacterium]|nr:amidohydrolase family protein [Rubricoccaceae bacterium]